MVRPADPLTRTGRRVVGRVDQFLHRPLPTPPAALRRGPLRRQAFPSRLRSPRLTSQLGLVLGIAIGICFATGFLSHLIQHPPGWFAWPSRPVELYRVTQGVHVATGLASIPLLTAKLWSVYPKLFRWPPVRDPAHALERLSVLVLVSAVLFQLVTGVLNIAYWYAPMPFGFLPTHYWTAWVAIGALLLHIAVKLPIIRGALSRDRPVRTVTVGGLTRRGLLIAVGSTTGVLTLATVGQTLRPLRYVSVLAPRRPDIGPQGLPVNTSAAAANVTTAALDPAYRLTVHGPAGQETFSLTDLAALPQVTVELPIACVEGWSATGHWTGVRLGELIGRVGGRPGHDAVVVHSLQHGAYAVSIVDESHTADPLTLIATGLNGEPLHLDHGYPCRLIAPNRPGALQTKWLTSVTVVPP